MTYGTDGTESVPAYDCLAACDCGASWLAPSGGPAPRCACGRPGWWACPVAEVDALSGESTSGVGQKNKRAGSGMSAGLRPQDHNTGFSDSGGASRFFNRFGYYAKCPSGERHAGAEHLLWAADKTRAFGFRRVTREEWEGLPALRTMASASTPSVTIDATPGARAQGNVHPTVKRIALMRWLHALARTVPKLEPFVIGDLCAGSGSGAIAAHLDGVDWIGSEVCHEALEIARARLAWWQGLSHTAAAEFLATDVMPAPPPPADPRQRALW